MKVKRYSRNNVWPKWYCSFVCLYVQFSLLTLYTKYIHCTASRRGASRVTFEYQNGKQNRRDLSSKVLSISSSDSATEK
jgi:hypothetical protein